MYEGNIDEHYGILVEHFIEGENYEKGAKYSKLAGKKSEKMASFNNAIAYARKGILCLEKLPASENLQKKIVDTGTALGLYFIQLDYLVEAKEAVDPIIDVALRLNYKRRLSQIYTIIGQYESQVEDDFPKALDHFEEALKISMETNDFVTWVLTSWCSGLALMFNCEFEKASYHFGKALEINAAANVLWGVSAMKTYLSWVHLLQGNIHQGYQTSDEAVRIAEESGDVYSKATAYPIRGLSCVFKGFLTEAEKYLIKGVDFSERIDFWALNGTAHYWLGEVYHQIREYERSNASYEKAVWSIEQAKFGPSLMGWARIALARAKVMNNEKDIDLESFHDCAKGYRIKAFEGLIERQIAEILLNIDDQHISDAEDWIKKAIEANKRNGMVWNLGRDYALYAELFKQKGDQSKAKENLNKAIEIYRECGADGWLKKAEKELAALS